MSTTAQSMVQWQVTPCGIRREVNPQEAPFFDELEASGQGVDFLVTYGTKAGGLLFLKRCLVYPTLRTIPNDPFASFQVEIPPDQIPALYLDGSPATETASAFEIEGMLKVVSLVADKKIRVERIFYPAASALCGIEKVTLINEGEQEVTFSLDAPPEALICRGRGTKGVYRAEMTHTALTTRLQPHRPHCFHLFYSARITGQPRVELDAQQELTARKKRISLLRDSQAILDTGNEVVDRLFAFSKIRAGESLFSTDGGLMHCPGGRTYYAATWCNDEVQYAGPWFALTGDALAMQASMTAYSHYIPFMDDNYERIPTSVIAEGRDIWEGAGDRGDAAMYLCGASLFALYSGSQEIARKLWKPIQWCAEYCRRNTTEEGVIRSDSDETEGRFPTDGKANLSTSMLCLQGLRAAAVLAADLGEPNMEQEYLLRAGSLEAAAEAYFGADLHGFHTYRYSKGYDTLRGWICLPLVADMTERATGTVEAILSPYLWTENGMLSCELGEENPSQTIWDRSALYGFQGIFRSGQGDRAWQAFEHYCKLRLLGDRVPYPVEAWPEGNKRHLSAESALFCRAVTEGLLGLTPTGLRSFRLKPFLPRALDHLYLKKLHLAGASVDVFLERGTQGEGRCTVHINGKERGTCRLGESMECTVAD